MRPNEFIKENGIEKAIELYNSDDWSTVSDIFLHDLKRLIESHDLVQNMGGIDKSREIAIKEGDRGHIINEGLILGSIRDVESCQ